MKLPALSIDILAAVIALVQCESFEGAARELGITVSAMYKRVRAAEKALGCGLFRSTSAGIQPTSEGRIFHGDAVRAVEQATLAEQKIKALNDLNANRVLIGHSTDLPPKLLGFILRLAPSISWKLRIEHTSGTTPALVRRVLHGSLHAAFGELVVPPASLIIRQILEEPLVVCLPKQHQLATRSMIRPEDLDGERVIAVSRESVPAHHEEIESVLVDFGARIRIVADAYSAREALVMTEQQMGICFLPASLATSSSVVKKPMSVKALTRKSGLYVRDDNRHNAISAIVDLVLGEFAAAESQSRMPQQPIELGDSVEVPTRKSPRIV
jgi:DNA-binding transcriptional LysR family regulator